MPQMINPMQQQYDEFGRPIQRNIIPPGFQPPPSMMGIPPSASPQQPSNLPPPMVSALEGMQAPMPPPQAPPDPRLQPQIGPRETAYLQAGEERPTYEPPDKLSMILNAIAAGSEGFLKRSPAAGVKLAHELTMEPYERKLRLHEEKRASMLPGVESERATYGREVQAGQLGVQRGQLDLGQRGLESRERIATGQATATAKYREAMADISRIRAEAAKASAEKLTTEQVLIKLYEENPEKFAAYMAAKDPKESLERFQERMDIQYGTAAKHRAPPKPDKPTVLSPSQIGQQDLLRGRRLAQDDPEYQQFFEIDDGVESIVQRDPDWDEQTDLLYSKFIRLVRGSEGGRLEEE